MPKARFEAVRNRRPPLDEQIAEFERRNPKIADAMKIFGISMERYQGALSALAGPRISVSSGTVRLDR